MYALAQYRTPTAPSATGQAGEQALDASPRASQKQALPSWLFGLQPFRYIRSRTRSMRSRRRGAADLLRAQKQTSRCAFVSPPRGPRQRVRRQRRGSTLHTTGSRTDTTRTTENSAGASLRDTADQQTSTPLKWQVSQFRCLSSLVSPVPQVKREAQAGGTASAHIRCHPANQTVKPARQFISCPQRRGPGVT